MSHKEKTDGFCNAKIREHRVPDEWDQDVAYCANRAGFRTEHFDEGRCYLHGGASVEANKGNNHAEKHGLYADRQNYYKNRSPEQQEWIDAVVESLLDDAPFDQSNFAKLQMVRNIAIDMHKMQDANSFIDTAGLVQKDKTVGYGPQGEPIKEDKENPVNVTYDRLNRTMTRQLKELGCLSDPDTQQAEANENIASELSKLRSARKDD